jgi:O-antigen/teichoic acid export membrane protein
MYFYNINAYAYIYHGKGSIILQALAGAIAAISSFFYYYGKKVKDFFKKFKNNKKENKEDIKEDSE